MAGSKCPTVQHATTSKSGAQVLHNDVALACFKRILCQKKKRKFCTRKILYSRKIPELVIYENWHLQNNQNQNLKNCENVK